MAPGTDLSVLASEVEEAQNTTLPKKNTGFHLHSPTKGLWVADPSTISEEFDELRFEAAAFRQLSITEPSGDSATTNSQHLSSLLVSSPYNSPGHYLDLSTLDTANLIFAKALTALKPVREDYATAPYISALNFSTVLSLVRALSAVEKYEWKEESFYVVTFHSKLNKDIDSDLLYDLDAESHREACESGGLLKYWFGKPNGERRNLATCFWRSREDAYKGGGGPWHRKARAAGKELYENIVFSTHRFTILDGAKEFVFEDW